MTEKRLKEKIALVTGAGSGIGRAIAEVFAREGAIVGVNYFRNSEGAEETLSSVIKMGSKGILLQADVSDPQAVEEMTSRLVESFGSIDIPVSYTHLTLPTN